MQRLSDILCVLGLCHQVLLDDGPALSPSPAGAGFYYDAAIFTPPATPSASDTTSSAASTPDVVKGTPVSVHSSDFQQLLQAVQQIVNDKQRFERLEVSKEVARKLFAYNKFKLGTLVEHECTSRCHF
jgi:threonyl-tRNA synthetase